ncbi:MAG TPA: FAD-dependent monooxygenase [Candidatus Saccharimonadales bacterium]|nr:FAD-dependent monooxygenase [Candidatus Saccharimonadales bacterium]
MAESNADKQLKVIIIGAGVGGRALALFLKKIGMKADVYEAYPYTKGVGGGLNVAPNGMWILDALGLAGRIKQIGSSTPIGYFEDGAGKSLGQVTYGDVPTYGQPAVSLSRAALNELLADELQAKNIPVHYEKKLVRVEETTDGVIAHFADGSSAKGDILVGADGVHSTVRGHLLPTGPSPKFVGVVAVGGFTALKDLPPINEVKRDAMTYVFGTNFFGYCGGDNGYMMWWANVWRKAAYSPEELANLDDEAIKRELLTMYGSFHSPVPELIERSGHMLKLSVFDIQSLPTWHKGRIVLIGDAAHAVSPNAGQGASMALEDAMYLAKMLRDKDGYEQAFTCFENDRKNRVEAIVAEGRRRGGDKKTASPFKARIRNMFMKHFLKKAAHAVDPNMMYRIDW